MELDADNTLDPLGPSGGALVEYERLRRKLGFMLEPAPAIAGRYELERTLGRGAMGEVHLVLDTRLERRVALKLVKPSANMDPGMLQARLEREALALARVDHPNVVGLHDVGTHDGQTYFTMQYVPGEPLRSWQTAPERTRTELIDAYLQAARGLAAAHAVNVVHRDFKPDNAIVGDDGVIRVLDFGIAAALQGDDAELLSTGERVATQHSDVASTVVSEARETATDAGPQALTRRGTLLGTLPYMSPEQLRGRRSDARSDQFGLCVAMWEALAGQRPFAGKTADALLQAIQAGPAHAERLPRYLRSVLRRGLSPRADDRWPDIATMIAAIERVQTRRRRVAIGLGLGVALVAASVVGRAAAPDHRAPQLRCETWIESIDAAWGPTQRERLEAFEHAEYTVAQLDALAAAWRRSAARACVDEAAPPSDVAPRSCLDAWRGGLADTVALLTERGDRNTLARAPDLLARLRAPNGDYCALQPSQAIDPEVERLAANGRALVVLGDIAAATELSEQALARARELDRDRFGVELAVAHFARAEVAAFAGDAPLALQQLAASEQHALATSLPDLLLPTWVLWAKLLALTGTPEQAEPALAFVDRAEAVGVNLALGEHDPRSAELLEARGLGERARGEHEQAIALHRRARDRFIAAEQPTLAAKSLINIGANFQLLDQADAARSSYAEAVALLREAGLPPGYRNRVQLERNLGLLAYAEDDPAELAKGVVHLEFVLAHGTASEARDALEPLLGIAIMLKDQAMIARYCEQILAALDGELELEQRVRLQRMAGFGLLRIDDARGEALLVAAEQGAEQLSPIILFNLQDNWIDWLESVGRCEQAGLRRAAVSERMLSLAPEQRPPDFDAWRLAGPQHDCAKP